MVTQLHLALVMAIDARLLVLDEPTLGLDILYRKQFYDSLLNDYFDRSRTIVVTTHQVEEIQHVLTDVMFIDRGRIVFDCSMEELESRYLEVMVHPEQLAAARALKPMHERQGFGRSILLFDRAARSQSQATGRAGRGAHAQHRRLVRCGVGDRAGRPRYKERPMNTPSNAMPESHLESQVAAPAAISATRRMYWSVRRELWENRSIYIAPLAAAALFLFGFLISTIHLPAKMRACRRSTRATARSDRSAVRHGRGSDHVDRSHRRSVLLLSTRCTANAAIAASCSGSRCRFPISRPCSRRRAFRSLFFRCSPSRSPLPRSCIMLLLSSAVLLGSGLSVATLWTQLSFVQMSLLLLYHLLTVHALWYAPFYGWLLLVSGWARRAAFLWAALPLLAIGDR